MSGPAIYIDDRGVRRELPDGTEEHVSWEDLLEVAVRTTGDGPFAEDVFFVLAGEGGTGCVVPQSAPEGTQLLERLQWLSGFDNAALIQAMSSTQDATFVCWRR
jgi:hypothetical protein